MTGMFVVCVRQVCVCTHTGMCVHVCAHMFVVCVQVYVCRVCVGMTNIPVQVCLSYLCRYVCHTYTGMFVIPV